MTKQIVIPFGPQHPALKEPAGFDVTLKVKESQIF